jgi:hypothetical protein
MIAHMRLFVASLQRQLADLEGDLRARSVFPEVEDSLRSWWQEGRSVVGTPPTYEVWRDEQVTQAAAAWLLGTVFLRFCEDNGLVAEPYLAGRGDRRILAEGRQREFSLSNPHATDLEWIRTGLAELGSSWLTPPLLDRDRGPIGSLEPSEGAAGDLIAFWRASEDGEVIFDFTDPQWNTSFLGELYQELSEQQRFKYALLETPRFIADFVLDHTLEAAIQNFGLDQLRAIDPVCGSGTFLLAAFTRLLRAWRIREPALTSSDLVRRCLRSLHGADKNPMAVAITRFRLAMAALKACGAKTLIDAPYLPVIVGTGDSLLLGRGAPQPHGQLDLNSGYEGNRDEFSDADLLGARSYHAVFGNPPYMTPKEKAEAEVYREAYPNCIGAYALTIPFIERFFWLGVESGEEAGYVGLIAANSFMKREFGRGLIENFFPTVDLTHVIDTSGVFIPGHGAPTVILFGRNRQPRNSVVDLAVALRGEPQVPSDPARGVVWQSMLKGVDHASYRDDWIQVLTADRADLSTFPWNLSDEEVNRILRRMEHGVRLGHRVARIGYYASTGADDVFIAPKASFQRIGAERDALIPVITGSEVRDWRAISEAEGALFSGEGNRLLPIEDFPHLLQRLWPYKTILELRRNYSGHSYREDGRPWYAWHHITQTPRAHPWSIVFSWVSTHNHFAIVRDRVAPLSSAPVIRLPNTASDSDVVQLAALLNSSLACFWLKHYSNSKGQPKADQTGTGEPWTLFYEFAGTRLADFPLPPDRWSGDRWSVHAEQLDGLARELTATAPRTVLQQDQATSLFVLDDACVRWQRAQDRIVGLQEELDWEIYGRYGVVTDAEELLAPDGVVPNVRPGERAFEIVLARRVSRGNTETTWFSRHSITPMTDIPTWWPARYRQVVENRIQAIEGETAVGLVERPEFKRRWATEPWEAQEKDAIRDWLLDRCESRSLWYEYGSHDELQPRPLTVGELSERLSEEDDFVAMAARFSGDDAAFSTVVAGIVRDEYMPYLAALRYTETGLLKHAQWEQTWRMQSEAGGTTEHESEAQPPRYTSADFLRPSYWRLRGKFDVPKERFISYPYVTPDDELLLGWAGWRHEEQAHVLINLIKSHTRDGNDSPEVIVPLLAGLKELLPWLRQWGRTPQLAMWGSNSLGKTQDFLTCEQTIRALSDGDLTDWRPPKPKRGRPRKRQ